MPRAISLAVLMTLTVLMTFAAPSAFAAPPGEDTTVAQQQQPAQSAPRRGCDKKQDEGVS